MNDPTVIPDNWNFIDKQIVDNFEIHVVQQLPWYELATDIITHLGEHYLPRNGCILDIGCATGNITRALEYVITQRNCDAISIDNSAEMIKAFNGIGTCTLADISDPKYRVPKSDFIISFLTLMFIPVDLRRQVIERILDSLRPGGAFVFFEKFVPPNGYLSTVFARLTWKQKLKSGVSYENISRKELSLSGYQRPLDFASLCLHDKAIEIFRFGDFAGYVIEK